MQLRVAARPVSPDKGSGVESWRDVYLEYVFGDGGRECVLHKTALSRAAVDRLLAAFAQLAPGIPVVSDPPGNLTAGFTWEKGQQCPGHGDGGTANACCARVGEYNGFPDETLFTCPKHCPCHD